MAPEKIAYCNSIGYNFNNSYDWNLVTGADQH